MDEKAMEIRVSGQEETSDDSVPSAPSLGSTSGYAAYRAAAYMPELAEQEKEKILYQTGVEILNDDPSSFSGAVKSELLSGNDQRNFMHVCGDIRKGTENNCR